MARSVRFLLLVSAAGLLLALFSGQAFAQTTTLNGQVLGEDGKPLKDAVILIERTDIKGNYKTKSDKRGNWIHAGLPIGQYKVKLEVEGKVVDQVGPVRASLGEQPPINFNLAEVKKRMETLARGEATDEQKRGMSEEARKEYEAQMAKRAESMKKNKELNDTFNAGMEAMKNGDYDTAIASLTKGSELDPKQFAIWANLADCYAQVAAKKTGDEKTAAFTKGIEAYTKAIELKPDDGAAHNNLGILYAKAGKIEPAQEELKKAVALDPTQASKYYYNLGAVLTNTGQLDAALEAFKSAIAANENNADAHYQYGLALMGKATALPDGTIQPPAGTKEAFEKYLQLAPTGKDADSAKLMIESLGSKLETKYDNPDAKKKAPPAAKPKKP